MHLFRKWSNGNLFHCRSRWILAWDSAIKLVEKTKNRKISDNKKISIATDIGHINNNIIKHIDGSEFILLEANYDPEVLRCSSYPFSLKSRIAGPNGHLPNETAGKTIAHLLQSGLKQAMLGHLSKESNFPELAYQTVLDELIRNDYNENSLSLGVASRDAHSKLIEL